MPEFGDELIQWLEPRSGEWVLDVGCGTGELTVKLVNQGCEVIGLDSSRRMLAEAKNAYPNLQFVCADIQNFRAGIEFDAVFSNAALHWVQDPRPALDSIFMLLRPGGRFVAEMGFAGNIRRVRTALHELLAEFGYDPTQYDPWYFPTKGSYEKLLNEAGFSVRRSEYFDRSSKLFGEEGLRSWLLMFTEEFLVPLNDEERDRVLRRLVNRLRDDLYEGGEWVLRYKRLRFDAVK